MVGSDGQVQHHSHAQLPYVQVDGSLQIVQHPTDAPAYNELGPATIPNKKAPEISKALRSILRRDKLFSNLRMKFFAMSASFD